MHTLAMSPARLPTQSYTEEGHVFATAHFAVCVTLRDELVSKKHTTLPDYENIPTSLSLAPFLFPFPSLPHTVFLHSGRRERARNDTIASPPFLPSIRLTKERRE